MIHALLTYRKLVSARAEFPRASRSAETYIQIFFGFFLRRPKARHHRLPCGPSASMALRVKEYLAIAHVHGRSTRIVVHSKIVVVLCGPQNFKSAVVSFEERQCLFGVTHLPFCGGLQSVVRVFQLLETGEDDSGARMGERHTVALGQLPFEVGSQGAFDVDVELDFRESFNEWTLCIRDGRPQFPAIVDGEGAFYICHLILDGISMNL